MNTDGGWRRIPLVIGLDLHANDSLEIVNYTSAISIFGLIRTWIWHIRSARCAVQMRFVKRCAV